jgi:xanthine phosphoribosyltransferase
VDQITIPWSVFQQDVVNLAQQIENSNKRYEVIVAITRGGLVPSVILAHKLKIRAIDTIDLRSYSDEHEQDDTVRIVRACDYVLIHRKGKGVLIVDDLIDTGNTIEAARKMLPEADVAVVYARSNKIDSVDYYGRAKPNDTWLVFPFET